MSDQQQTISAGLSANAIGLIAGVGTFVVICIVFGIIACIALCRLRSSERPLAATIREGRGKGDLTREDTEQSMSSNSNFRTEIMAKHFLQNGFHRVIEEDEPGSPAKKQKLKKVVSTPPPVVRDPVHCEETDGQPTNTLQLPEVIQRSRSLKVGKIRSETDMDMCGSTSNCQTVSKSWMGESDLQTALGEQMTRLPKFGAKLLLLVFLLFFVANHLYLVDVLPNTAES